MSKMRPIIDGWIGYGDGASMLVETGVPLDADHPLVKERPELFVAVPEEPKRLGRPKASDG